MNNCKVYENQDMRKITGDTLRPGGFFLTDRAVTMCDFKPYDKLLDIGCGMGETVNRLSKEYHYDAFGIDPSDKLLELGRKKYGDIKISTGIGECLPFEDEYFNGVFAECTISLMDDWQKTILEAKRVLKTKGLLIISDVYARKEEYINELQKYNVNSCMRGLLNISNLKDFALSSGFEIICYEDWTDLLKSLMVKIIFKYGSMAEFWGITTCSSCGDFQQKLTLCKPGYFFMVLIKK